MLYYTTCNTTFKSYKYKLPSPISEPPLSESIRVYPSPSESIRVYPSLSEFIRVSFSPSISESPV